MAEKITGDLFRATRLILGGNPQGFLSSVSDSGGVSAQQAEMKTFSLLRIAAVTLSVILVSGCATPSWDSAKTPELPEVKIVDPPPGLKPEVTSMLGTWEGAWDGILPSRLIVYWTDGKWTGVVYAWADDPSGRFKGGWGRLVVEVSPGSKLEWWAGKVKFTFVMADPQTIRGERLQDWRTSAITMKKVEKKP